MNVLSDFDRELLIGCKNLGVGNFFDYALRFFDNREKDFLFTDKPIRLPNGNLKKSFSLISMNELCDQLAYWYRKHGVGPNDCVCLYMESSIAFLFNQIALNRLGAIPVYANGNLNSLALHQYLSKFEITGVVTDENKKDYFIEMGYSDRLNFIVSHNDIRIDRYEKVNYYNHSHDSPILISHSSGTTGSPKAIVQRHGLFFYGIRQFLREKPDFSTNVPYTGRHSYLSVLPTAHNSFLAYCIRAILTQAQLVVITNTDYNHVNEQIDRYKPSVVVAFSHVYQNLVRLSNLDQTLQSVSYWINTGDAAHLPHIKKLISYGHYFNGNEFCKGSIFLDGLGSSEMGSTYFRIQHDSSTNHPLRCVGFSRAWVKAKIIDENNNECPPLAYGKLAVFAPPMTTGYWNDNSLTEKSKFGDYIFTGDIGMFDIEGKLIHLDRISDVIKTDTGVIFSTLGEEIIFSLYPNIHECVIFQSVDEVKKVSPSAIILCDKSSEDSISLEEINHEFEKYKMSPLSNIHIAHESDIPKGVTGKVLKKILRNRYSNDSTQKIRMMKNKLYEYKDFIPEDTILKIFQSKFIQHCLNGSLTRAEFNEFLAQHYLYSSQFLRYLCSVIARLPSKEDRGQLLKNLVEELGADKLGINHASLYKLLLSQFKIDISSIETNPKTDIFVDKMLSYCQNQNPLVGLSALCLGAELLVPFLYTSIVIASEHLGILDDQMIYFSIHIDCDDGHADIMLKIIKSFLESDVDRIELCQNIAKDIIESRIDLYDSLITTNLEKCGSTEKQEIVNYES